MASPNYNSLSVQHSRNIGDSVTAAGTNGGLYTSVQRDYHLNSAIKRFIRVVINANKIKHLQQLPTNYDPIEQYVKESPSVALAANAISLTSASFTGGEVDTVISVVNVNSGTVYTKPLPIHLVHLSDANANSFISASASNQLWYVSNKIWI